MIVSIAADPFGHPMIDTSTRIRIGAWTAEPTLNLLKRDGRSVKLDPRAMDLLVYLANHAGEVVSVPELMTSVWDGRTPDDTQVYKTVTKIRKAFGDHPEDARYIETIPKRGYRLVAPVTPLAAERSNRAKAWKPAS